MFMRGGSHEDRSSALALLHGDLLSGLSLKAVERRARDECDDERRQGGDERPEDESEKELGMRTARLDDVGMHHRRSGEKEPAESDRRGRVKRHIAGRTPEPAALVR